MTASLTRVDANAQLQLVVGKMTHTEYKHVTEEIQSHAGDLTRVFDPVQLGTTADYHVCITDRLHLTEISSEQVTSQPRLDKLQALKQISSG